MGTARRLFVILTDKVSSAPEGFDLADGEGGSSDDLDGSHVVSCRLVYRELSAAYVTG